MTEHQERGATRAQLLDTAERLIAEHGPAVSTRQIVADAGQRNHAAVRYHFGNRDELISAIVQARQELLERRRLELLAQLESEARDDLARLVEALLVPVFEMQRSSTGPCHHARFMEKVRDYPGLQLGKREDWPATSLIISRLEQRMGRLPAATRSHRAQFTMTAVLALLADLERTEFADDGARAEAEQMVVDMVVGLARGGTSRA
ncbi:TetR family transcriptional regulator [Nocardioides sp.]|uniref:TetR family transcriptional regulator n=1 Tax=Nocardioides sp. TaxID=35761 RepID=UPI0035653EE9